MHHVQTVAVSAEIAELQPQGQGAHPLNPWLIAARKLLQRGGVLGGVLFIVTAKVLARMIGIGGVPAYGVELVIAHEAFRGAGLAHVADDFQRFQNLRPPVDVVAEKYDHSVGMSPHAPVLFVAEAGEKGFQPVRTSVYVTYHVITIQHNQLQMPSGQSRNTLEKCRCPGMNFSLAQVSGR